VSAVADPFSQRFPDLPGLPTFPDCLEPPHPSCDAYTRVSDVNLDVLSCFADCKRLGASSLWRFFDGSPSSEPAAKMYFSPSVSSVPSEPGGK